MPYPASLRLANTRTEPATLPRRNDDLETTYPGAEESLLRLHEAGWSVVCTRFQGEAGPVWIVSGYNGENQVLTASADRDEAWWHACLQARSAGMLRLGRAPGPAARD